MLNLARLVPRALGVIVGSIALAGGAVGAAASAGGTEVPRPIEAVLEVLGFGADSAHLDAAPSPTGTPGPRNPRPSATATPASQSVPGLCNAYRNGSPHGRERKLNGTAFHRLQHAADAAGQDIDAFCASLMPRTRATPTSTATAVHPVESSRGKPPATGEKALRANNGDRSHGDDDRRGASGEREAESTLAHGTDGERNDKSEAPPGHQKLSGSSPKRDDDVARVSSGAGQNVDGLQGAQGRGRR